MIKERAMELVAALRSGEYEQGQGYLHRDNKFCCFGVACDLAVKALPEQISVEKNLFQDCYYYDGDISFLPKTVQEYFGFFNWAGLRRDKKLLKIGDQEVSHLVAANDVGISFNEIANYIEDNWKYL